MQQLPEGKQLIVVAIAYNGRRQYHVTTFNESLDIVCGILFFGKKPVDYWTPIDPV